MSPPPLFNRRKRLEELRARRPRKPRGPQTEVGDWYQVEEDAHGEEASGVFLRLDEPSDSLLIAFGGLGTAIGIPVFEFFNVVSTFEQPVKQMFIRDLQGAWYHRGVVAAGDTIEEVAEYVREVVRTSGARRVVTVGNSAGGYAALLFGSLIEATQVLAFGPQTFISARLRLIHRDRRFGVPLRRLRASRFYDPAYADLRKFFEARGNTTTRFTIHHAADHRLDALHARRMRGLAGVELHEHRVDKRTLVRELRDRGELKTLLEAALHGGVTQRASAR